MYVLVRNDLSPAQKAVQSCHAAIEAARYFLRDKDEHPHLVLCLVKDEKKLKSIIQELYESGIHIRAFREPDIGNQLTAIATEPLCGERRSALSRFQLLT